MEGVLGNFSNEFTKWKIDHPAPERNRLENLVVSPEPNRLYTGAEAVAMAILVKNKRGSTAKLSLKASTFLMKC